MSQATSMPTTPSSVEHNSPVNQPASPDTTPFPPPASDDAARNPPRRKPSRRANTAERRATHNAVERQRRETLNGRFLDLAALLPNLASVRRPSKSAIVNSSIALIHSQRRARAIAAHELRLLKAETDALRRELNDWRERTHSGPRIDEPARSAEFVALINLEDVAEEGEDERRAYAMRDAIAEDDDEYEGYEDYPAPSAPTAATASAAPIPIPAPANTTTSAAPRFDYGLPPQQQQQDKMAAWNAHIYNAFAQSQWASQQQQQQQQQQQAFAAHVQAQAAQVQAQQAHAAAAHAAALFTPPGSAHGPSPNSAAAMTISTSPFAHAPISTPGRSPVGSMFPSYPSAPPTSAHSSHSAHSLGLVDDDGTSSVGSFHETQTPPRGSPIGNAHGHALFPGAGSPFADVNGASATGAEAFAAAFHAYPRTAVGDWSNKSQLAAMGLLM